MIRTWTVFVDEKLRALMNNRHVLFPWRVMHAEVVITRYKICPEWSKNMTNNEEQDAAVRRESCLDDAH